MVCLFQPFPPSIFSLMWDAFPPSSPLPNSCRANLPSNKSHIMRPIATPFPSPEIPMDKTAPCTSHGDLLFLFCPSPPPFLSLIRPFFFTPIKRGRRKARTAFPVTRLHHMLLGRQSRSLLIGLVSEGQTRPLLSFL